MIKKRGRKAGSVSFAQVTLEELNRTLKPGARVIVWGRYAQMLGLKGSPVEAKPDVLIAAVGGGTADVEVKEFGTPQVTTKKSMPHQEDLVPKPHITIDMF